MASRKRLIANLNCEDNELIRACKAVDLHDDIMKFDMQYKTKIGANGILLSNGQLQKLNFARALIKKGSLFLFDEIDSGLDGRAEDSLMQNIRYIAKNSIVLFITHRRNVLKYARKIYIMDKGKIIESGDDEYLLQNSKEYKLLFSTNKI